MNRFQVTDNCCMASDVVKLKEIIDMMWVRAENAEWKPKIKIIPGAAFRLWMASFDMEVLGYTYHLLDDHRFRVDPELWLNEYVEFVRRYYERCLWRVPTASGLTVDIPQAGIWLTF